MREIGRALGDVEYKIGISGHTDAAPFPGGERGYGNWDLSADRANAARRELMTAGMDEKKILRVVGLASSVPFKSEDPFDASNRRISIVVLNRAAEESITRDGPMQGAADPGESVEAAASSIPAAPSATVLTPASTSLLRSPLR